jgi:predicted MFS family arabinose efflux permease
MSRRLTLIFAVVCGVAVANLYYAQPLLDAIASSLDVSAGTAAFVVTATQLGYAAGLVLLVPLGDLLERRALIMRMTAMTVVALLAAAAAPSLAVLGGALAVVGVTATVAQVLVPLSATLSGAEDGGRVVGVVMSGLLLGILAARTVSGVIAGIADWRTVYVVAAVAMLISGIVLRRELPVSHGESTLQYRALLRSIATLVRQTPLLRRRMLYGAAGMAGFSAFWTTLTLLLSDPPYGYGELTIGLFGLLGIAGAASAQVAGRLADGGRLNAATGAFLVCVLASWGLLALAPHSLAALMAGIVLFDLGIQGQHICNQSAIYAAQPGARSRVTTAYMTSNFLWGALGSAGAAAAYSAGGWGAVSAGGAGVALLALVAWVQEQRVRRGAATLATSRVEAGG